MFDVVIFRMGTQEVVSIVGTNLNQDKADKREMTALGRINLDEYSVAIVRAGWCKVGERLPTEVEVD